MEVLDRPQVTVAGTNLRNLTVPSGADVVHATIKEVASGETAGQIVVFQVKMPSYKARVREFAEAIRGIPHSPLSQFYVINVEKAAHVNAELAKSILDFFPQPERIEITNSKKKLFDTLETLIAKATLSLERNNLPAPPRTSPLDQVGAILKATEDLRADSGRLSAKEIAPVFGLKDSELARFLGKSRQSVFKTPDAEGLQDALGYFERVARLRTVIKDDVNFRKWLRTSNPALEKKRPLDLLEGGSWQILADFVDDILTGSPG